MQSLFNGEPRSYLEFPNHPIDVHFFFCVTCQEFLVAERDTAYGNMTEDQKAKIATEGIPWRKAGTGGSPIDCG